MSDYEDEFMCDEDEDYDLEYSEDSNSEPDVDLENQYYNSKVREKRDQKMWNRLYWKFSADVLSFITFVSAT